MKDLVKKTRGTVNHFSDDSLEFVPQGKGEPVYEHSYKVGEAQIGLTKGKAGKFREDTWRLQSAAVLTGLVMLDYDHIEFPARDFMERIPRGGLFMPW